MTRFIESRRDRFEVELLCCTLGASPSTYYARRSRPPSARAITDAWLHEEIERVFKANYSVYGARRVWRQLHREGITLADLRVRQLPRMEVHGVTRAALALPERLEVLEETGDDLYPGRSKLKFAFFLPRGCYATLVIKRLQATVRLE